MDPIKDIIHRVIEDISLKQPETQFKIQKIWKETIGEKALKHTNIVGFDNGRLTINVDSPAWLFQMNLKRPKALKEIQREVPEVKYIIFRIGKV